jgi:hypothetical protein
MTRPRYDQDTLDAEDVQRQIKADQDAGTGLGGIGGFYQRRHQSALVRDRRIGVHRIYILNGRTGDGTCTCGLIVDQRDIEAPGVDVLTLPGHLDPETGRPAERLVGSVDGDGSGGYPDQPYRAVCRRCGWAEISETLEETLEARGRHPLLCNLRGIRRPVPGPGESPPSSGADT